MKIIRICFFLSLTLFIKVLHAKDVSNSTPQKPSISFTENKGQFADQNYNSRPDILFGGSDGQMTFHITNKGISYQQYRVDSYREEEDPKTGKKIKEIIQQTIYRTDIKWVNANVNPLVTTDDILPGYSNYYLEQCSNGALEVKSYKGITLKNIYSNIDLHYYAKEGQLKCDYIVAPHTDYKQIQLKVEGAILKLQNDGSLIIETPLGKIQEQTPIVYQNGKQLEAHYKINNNHISFEVENYDSHYQLIIDPVTRLWGTYYGGAGDEDNRSCTTDTYGNVYMVGQTASTTGTLIATVGSHQSVYGGGPYDGFLVKFNGTGLRLWATYYGGGTGNDYGYGCSSDVSGNVYMAGYTASNGSTVIATTVSHQSAHGGAYDAFLVKFDSGGIRSWGTYYGGTGFEYGHSCAVDASGNVYMAGYTYSTTGSNAGFVLATAGSHQSTYGGGNTDAFLVKFTSSGVRSWATYYGDTGDDQGESCATDAFSNVYMAGYTAGSTGTTIASAVSHQSVNGGVDDAFLVKFSSSGVRAWGTYYGGIGSEFFSYCATDALGNVYLTGSTTTSTGTAIATTISHQNVFGGGNWDAYLAQFNSSGVRQWSTYYGGTGDDKGYFCTTDASGNVYIVGFTDTNNGTGIATSGSHQSTYGGGVNNGYLAKFNNNGFRSWGTYYGGGADDRIYSCTSDSNGYIYVSGTANTNSGTAIATAGSWQSAHGGGATDAFLVKFADCTFLNQPSAISGPISVCAAATQSYLVANDPAATSYSWSLPVGWTGTSVSNTILATPGSTGIFTLTSINLCGTSPQTTLQVLVNPLPTLVVNSGSICSGESFTIIPNNANTYTITGGNFTVTPSVTSSYSVTGTSTAGCVSSVAAISNVTVYETPTLAVNSGSICLGESFVITPSGANNYTVTGGSFTVSPGTTTSYSVIGMSSNGCISGEEQSSVIVDICTDLNENSWTVNGSIKMYPNPSSGLLHIESTVEGDILIIDLQGRLVSESKISAGLSSISIEHIENGVYFVEILHPLGKQVFRVVKQ